MSSLNVQDILTQIPVSSQRTFPAAPFPHKYIHSVMNELHDVVHAVLMLRMAGYDAEDIHVMASWDFVDATEHKLRRQNGLVRAWNRWLALLDEGYGDVYLREAQQGRHILLVRLARCEQIEQVRALLAARNAYRMKYVDAWTVRDLHCSNNVEMQRLVV